MLRVAGLALLAGGLLSLGLDALGAPEALLRFLYGTLLGGLDVPDDPPAATVTLVRDFAIVAGVAELVAGTVMVTLSFRSPPQG
ncbi:MAG: hypothetical protein U0R52_12155 [Solirubrobacterales bacterium]